MRMIVDINRSERDCNAILRFALTSKLTNGTVRTVDHHKFCFLQPEMKCMFHQSEALDVFVKQQFPEQDPKNAIMFSKEGWEARKSIQEEAETEIEQRTCKICLLTCGLAICCCGLWDNKKRMDHLRNEKYYLDQINQRYPDQQQIDVKYEFQAKDAASDPTESDVFVVATAPVETDNKH